jgi:hypothetical protein
LNVPQLSRRQRLQYWAVLITIAIAMWRIATALNRPSAGNFIIAAALAVVAIAAFLLLKKSWSRSV